MSIQESEFIPLSDSISDLPSYKGTIIKSGTIRNIQTKVIDIKEDPLDMKEQPKEEKKHISQIKPIMEDKKIVGLTHLCKCGETSEIRFDFTEDQTEEAPQISDEVEKNNLENDINVIDIEAESDDVYKENDNNESENFDTINLEEKLKEKDLDKLGNDNNN